MINQAPVVVRMTAQDLQTITVAQTVQSKVKRRLIRSGLVWYNKSKEESILLK